MDDSANLHAVIGCMLRATMQMLLMTAGPKYGSPASRPRITFTGTIGIDDDMGKGFGVRHTVNLLGLGCLPDSGDFQLLGSIG